MSDETVWDKIQAKSKKVEELDALYEKTKKDFSADGTIDADEQKKLDEIKNGIATANTKIKALETEFKANKKKWEGRASDLAKVKSQRDELTDWDPDVDILGDIDETIANAEGNATDMSWLWAIDDLDQAMAYVEAPYKEYQKQLPFRDEYNQDYPKLVARLDKLWQHEYSEIDSISQTLEAAARPIESAEDAAKHLRYDDACRYLNDVKDSLDDADGDIKEMKVKEDKCIAELNSLIGDAAIYAKSKFDSVQEMNEAFEGMREEIQSQLDATEFDKTLAELKVARKLLDEIIAEEKAKEAEKASYDSKEGVLNDCNNKINEVAGTTLEISKAVVSTASSLVKAAADIATDAAKQDWKGAAEKIDGLKTDAEELYKSFGDEKKKAEEKKAWDDRVGDVAELKAETALLVEWEIDKASDVRKTIEDAEKKAGAEQYVEAVAALDKATADIEPLKEELDEEKRAELEYKGLKASFDAELKQIKASKFAGSAAVKTIVDQIQAIVEPIAEHVAGKQFKLAKEVIESAAELVKKALDEVTRLIGVQKSASDLYDSVKDKLSKASEKAFESLKDIHEATKKAADEVGKKVESVDDPDDTLIAARDASSKGDELIKKYEEKLLEQQSWDKKEKDLEAVEKTIEELKKMNSSSADELRKEMAAANENAKTEKFEEAVKQLEDLKNKAKEAMEEEEEALQMASEEEEEVQMSSDEEEEAVQLSDQQKKEREEEMDDIEKQLDEVEKVVSELS